MPITCDIVQEVGVLPLVFVLPLLVQGTQSTHPSSNPLFGSCWAVAVNGLPTSIAAALNAVERNIFIRFIPIKRLVLAKLQAH
jgi:hypothetical protein